MVFRVGILAAAVAGFTLASCVAAFAQTSAVQSGNWTDPSTWDAGEPDGTAATTPTTIDGSFTVTIDSPGATADLVDLGSTDGATGNLEITGGDLFLTDSTAVADFSPGLRLGQAVNSTGNLTMSGGTVFIDGDTVEPFAFARGDLMVGDNGAGTMTMTGGILSANDEIFMAFGPDSSASVDISGGMLETLGRNMLIGWAGDAQVNLSGSGTVNSANFIFASYNPGATSSITQTGGVLNAGGPLVLGRQGDSTYDHSGGAITTNVFIAADNFPTNIDEYNMGVLGSTNAPGATGTYNISDDATLDVASIMWLGSFGGGHGIVNQTGGTVNTGGIAVGRDGSGTYTISAGEFNQNGTDGFAPNNHLVVGQVGFHNDLGEGNGLFEQSGGEVTATTGVFLGDFDNSEGTYKISGGTLNVTGTGSHLNPGDFEDFIGDFSVGGALASNAATTRVDPAGPEDAQGQALDANGTFIVSGSAATIDIAGNFLANPADKHANRRDDLEGDTNRANSSTLVFEIFDASGTSLINVGEVADLDGAVVDLDLMEGFTPSEGATFDLLTASMFGATGTGTTQNVGTGTGFMLADEDAESFSLEVAPGGNGEILRATFLAAPPVLTGDYNDDGVVDAADYAAWRDNLGQESTLANDPIGGLVGQAHYDQWASNYGTTAPASGAVSAPEPASWLLLAIGAVAGLYRQKRCIG